MIEQTDRRSVAGLDGTWLTANGIGTARLGGGFRADDADVELWHSPLRVRREQLVGAQISERNFFLRGEQEWALGDVLRIQGGLRVDYFVFDVADRLDGRTDTNLPHASGVAHQALVSPKLNTVIMPVSGLEIFLNAGTGFHSNDARDVVLDTRVDELSRAWRAEGLSAAEIDDRLTERNIDPRHREADTLPRAVGAEVGMRVRSPGGRIHVTAALWRLDLEREFVFVGDAGTTEASGRTRRIGLDTSVRIALTDWLGADADVNLSNGRYVDEMNGEDRIPLAPRITSTGGLTARHPSGVDAAIRVVFVGDRPANETNSVTAEGYSLVNVATKYNWRDITLSVELENLLGVDWNEAQFDTESRLHGEVVPVSELHFTPGNPRNVTLGMTYRF